MLLMESYLQDMDKLEIFVWDKQYYCCLYESLTDMNSLTILDIR